MPMKGILPLRRKLPSEKVSIRFSKKIRKGNILRHIPI